MKAGAVNLSAQFEREVSPKSKETMLGCLLAYIKAENFEGKIAFIKKLDGLKKVRNWIIECKEGDKFGNEPTQVRKIRLKLLQLCYDLCLNDDSIFAGGYVVRNYFGKNKEFIQHLLDTLEHPDLETNQEI